MTSEYIYATQGKPMLAENGLVSLAREEIVRCRDCRRFYPDESPLIACRFELDNGFVQWRHAEPDGFCKWGERKTEDD